MKRLVYDNTSRKSSSGISIHWVFFITTRNKTVKRAIISDIHSNLEALTAVLADIKSQEVEDIYCLGDVVGYGPNPRECVDLIRQSVSVCLLGNHDHGAMYHPDGFNACAEQAIFWTREELEKPIGPTDQRDARWDFLGNLPRSYSEKKMIFVHGSARNPLNEYVFPEDIYHERKLEKIFAQIQWISFQGHTHVPGIFTQGDRYMFRSPEEFDLVRQLSTESKYMINVGSVGQPRDNDPRACYVIFDGLTVTYRRVAYDYSQTIAKIQAIPMLDNFLGERLTEGR